MSLVTEIRQEQLRQKRLARQGGANLPNAVEDVSVPFPWEAELRRVSPKTTLHSWLLAYWYRAGQRWVLYDALPVEQIDPDALQGCSATGQEILDALKGDRPSEAPEWKRCDFVSDVQHEMYRLHRVYARPFWVLQGERGGHQYKFSPWQQNVLMAKGLEGEPPAIGSLPPCPFDLRATAQLDHLNRLRKMEGSIGMLRASASVEHANAEMDAIQREIREAELAFIQTQMTPLVDMSMSLVRGVNPRSEHLDQIVRVRPGVALEAHDALQRYMETGDYVLRDITSR